MLSFMSDKKSAAAKAAQRRIHERQRTRLRPGKLASLNNEYLCDCTIRDISEGGLRLVLDRNASLPKEFYVFDAVAQTVAEVQLRWRDGVAAGVVYLVPPADIKFYANAGIRKLAQKFYAVEE